MSFTSIFLMIKTKQIIFSTSELPLSLVILFGVGVMTQHVMLLLSRTVILHCRQLRTAVYSISVQNIFKELEEFETFPQCHNSFNKRTFIGIFFSLIIVNLMFYWHNYIVECIA